MCQTTIVSSPLGPLAGRFALGVGAVAGLPLAARLAPGVVMWMAGALALTTAWAAVATIIAIRQRANTAVQAPPAAPTQRAPQRTTARVIASRTAPALESTRPAVDPAAARQRRTAP